MQGVQTMKDKPEVSQTTLWCVHIQGPDDLIAFPDQASAEREAAVINEAMERHAATREPSPNWPTLKAVAAVWPWSAEAHAADLARNIRDVECNGNA